MCWVGYFIGQGDAIVHFIGWGGCYCASLNYLFLSFPSPTGEDWCGSGALHWSIHGFYWWIHLCLSADSTNVPHVPRLQWAVHRQNSPHHQLCLCCFTHYQYPCVLARADLLTGTWSINRRSCAVLSFYKCW